MKFGSCMMGFVTPDLYPMIFLINVKELGIQVRIFEPLSPFLSTDQNNRDHRKITIVDGEVAFTGGFNLADEYVNFVHPYGHWKDVSVRGERRCSKNVCCTISSELAFRW